jgi:hypothetical protein
VSRQQPATASWSSSCSQLRSRCCGRPCLALCCAAAASQAPPLDHHHLLQKPTAQRGSALLLACIWLPNSPQACCSCLLPPPAPAAALLLPCCSCSAYNLSQLVELGVGGLQTSLGRALNKKLYQVSFDGKTKPVSEGLLPGGLLLLASCCQRAFRGLLLAWGCCLPEGCCWVWPARGGQGNRLA